MAQSDTELFAVATRLAREAGAPAPLRLVPLSGGKNNLVFRVETDGDPLVLKCYHSDPRDQRDRLGAEWSFLRHVWERGVRNVPRPLARDVAAHAAIYPFVPGRKLTPDEVGAAAVATAAGFIVEANKPPRSTGSLAPGSEACFSLADHLTTIRHRVARFDALDPEAPHRDSAAAFVGEVLRPAFARVEADIRTLAGATDIDIAARIPELDVIVSPSDFGFHNSLRGEDGTLTFIDFEYAGRDDPAKLASDFFCCPEVPVPLTHRAMFLRALREGIGLSDAFVRRADLLLDAYRIKWACIILNDFLPMDAARRALALPGERAARCVAQLDKAAIKLDEIGMT